MSSDETTYTIKPPIAPIVQIRGDGNRILLAVHPNGTVEGEIADAPEAARVFVEHIRGIVTDMMPASSDALRERCLEAAAIAAWNIRQPTQSDSLADKSDDYAIGYLSVLLERELYQEGWIIGEDLAEKLAEIAVKTVRQPTQSDALQAENEQLRHDLERQMTIANEHVNEVERLREKIKNIKEAWDWWQLDTYDRCASVVEDAINADLEE